MVKLKFLLLNLNCFIVCLVQRPINVKSRPRPRLPIPEDEDPYSIAGNNCISNENSDSSGYSGSSNSNGKRSDLIYSHLNYGIQFIQLVNDLIKMQQHFNCILRSLTNYQRNYFLRNGFQIIQNETVC